MLLLLLKCVFLVFVFKGKYRMGKKHMNYVYLFFKAKLGLFFVYFRPFLNTMTIIVQNLTILKHIWCAWDSNPGPQDCRRRLIQ